MELLQDLKSEGWDLNPKRSKVPNKRKEVKLKQCLGFILSVILSIHPTDYLEVELKDRVEETKPLTKTLSTVNHFNYVYDSMTKATKTQLSVAKIKDKMSSYGRFISNQGMPYQEYKEAMWYQWEDVTDYEKGPKKVTINIEEQIDYEDYVVVLKKLSRYEGVYLS